MSDLLDKPFLKRQHAHLKKLTGINMGYLIFTVLNRTKLVAKKGLSCLIYRYFSCVALKQLTFSEMIFLIVIRLNVKMLKRCIAWRFVKSILEFPTSLLCVIFNAFVMVFRNCHSFMMADNSSDLSMSVYIHRISSLHTEISSFCMFTLI
jgi:hypothetical protein